MDSSVAPSAVSSHSSFWKALHQGHDEENANHGRRDFTQASIESDQNLTARSTRFGNGKARIQSRKLRETPSARSPTPHRVTSETARALNKVLPPVKQISPTRTEPQLPKYPTTQHETSEPLVQYHADMPFSLPSKFSAQPTATIPLPEVPNLTELVDGYDHSRPIFDFTIKKCQKSRFAWAPQVGENTDRVSLPNTDEATPKYDQKKLLASIRSLETKVAQLQHLLAESDNNVQYLRQKAFEADSKRVRAGGRSDSALGSVSGGSEAGEDKSDAEHRKLMIEKDRKSSKTPCRAPANLARYHGSER